MDGRRKNTATSRHCTVDTVKGRKEGKTTMGTSGDNAGAQCQVTQVRVVQRRLGLGVFVVHSVLSGVG